MGLALIKVKNIKEFLFFFYDVEEVMINICATI